MQLTRVFIELIAARDVGVVERFAVGGAIGAAFYLEPAATQNVDLFIAVAPSPDGPLREFEPVYAFLKGRGAESDGEHLVIAGWKVQVLPAPSPLVEDALAMSTPHDIEGTQVPVLSAAHFAAIALETGRLKDKLRLQQFLLWDQFDQQRFLALVERFGLRDRWTAAQLFFRENP